MRFIDHLTRAPDDDREAMQQLLASLVAVPTENPPATGYAPCVELLVSTLARLGFPHETIDIPSPPGAPRTAIRAWLGTGAPALYFHGHYDVVPAASPVQFAPRLEGDTLFGRGSSDMKSGLVAMLYAARALQTANLRLNGRLELLFVPDEETGGAYGSGALAAAGRLGIDGAGMLLPEPTSGVVWHANRGAITLEISVKGRAAHAALQHQGVNAVARALPLLNRFLELKRELDAQAGSVLLVGGRVEAARTSTPSPRNADSPSIGAPIPARISKPRSVVFSKSSSRRDPGASRSTFARYRRDARPRRRPTLRWAAPWRKASPQSPARRRHSNPVPACSKSGSTPSVASRPSPMDPASSRSRTARRNS